ncbi:hypothetical protein ACET3Z_015785 [Daucus carota]
MIDKFNSIIRRGSFVLVHRQAIFNPLFSRTFLSNKRLFCAALPVSDTVIDKNDGERKEEVGGNYQPSNSREVLMKWGCTKDDVSTIFRRLPSLRNSNPVGLNSKLDILGEVGLDSSDLVRVVYCRPRFLSCCHLLFKERLGYLVELFGSRELLRKAVVRNPSLLVYDMHSKTKPVIELYEKMGIGKKDLVPMLISYPTLIPRTVFNEEKLSYIRRTGVSKDAKMYKYVVCIIGISRVETIREKIANFEKFGFQEDEVLQLIRRSPLLLTLSVEKVQRNMTFVLGTLKLSAKVTANYPFLLYANLETVLKPRVLMADKIKDMGLEPQIKGPALLRALRMKDDRFARAFILCHPQDVAEELMECYTNAKRVKRLAESSKKSRLRGFPF